MSMEILAPAGNSESLQAAVRCGADAVYLGASSFNARRNADNFDALSLSDAVRYCHGRNVRVYVTLNTLIFNDEENKFLMCLDEVLNAGPDSLIVQDLGVLHLIRSVCPEIPICASTQMAVCNSEGAHMLEDLGIQQAVLARELSLDEISEISSNTSLRLESFVHGAHCMSVSGLCYFSSTFGERSGNRGLCAQPCRMNFKCNGRDYALSLKDLSLIQHISELEKAGVSSLKIEGRMKRPEYVAAAVTAVRQSIQGKPTNLEDLKKVFSRSGFTDGYLMAKRNAKMFGIRSSEDISSSKEILGRMAALYRHELQSVPVDMSLNIDDCNISLQISDGKQEVSAKIRALSSNTGTLTDEIAFRCLNKTGNTPFYLNNADINIKDDLHIQASAINALRKQLLEELLQKRSVGIHYNRNSFIPEDSISVAGTKTPKIRARFSKISQIVSPNKFDLIIVPLEELKANPYIIEQIPSVCAELPTVIWPGMEKKLRNVLIELYNAGLRHATVGNIGHIGLLSGMDYILHGESTLNITNSHSLRKYEKLGLDDTILSSELTIQQAEDIRSAIPTGVFIFGRLPLMYFRSCPARSASGCDKCSGVSEITDKMHTSFPLICHQKQYSVMHNSVPLYLGDMTRPLVDFVEFYFLNESPEDISRVVSSYENKLKISSPYTRGHAFSVVR